ncbi:MAG: hypothetical protein JW966_01430 [Anaerolineae bacterium]|nr:hypothetical protein [Anaerolineae bacterium]
MPVPYCTICQQNEAEKQQYGDVTLERGDYCPICHQPVCRFHLNRVRWRWKTNGRLDSALICRDCRKSYRHRNWDAHLRDWID